MNFCFDSISYPNCLYILIYVCSSYYIDWCLFTNLYQSCVIHFEPSLTTCFTYSQVCMLVHMTTIKSNVLLMIYVCVYVYVCALAGILSISLFTLYSLRCSHTYLSHKQTYTYVHTIIEDIGSLSLNKV